MTHDNDLDRTVALKLVRQELVNNAESMQRFNLRKAIDAERSRQVRDLSGVPTAAHFTQWVTNAIAANICG